MARTVDADGHTIVQQFGGVTKQNSIPYRRRQLATLNSDIRNTGPDCDDVEDSLLL